MFRLHAIAVALILMTVLAVSGCVYQPPYYADAPYYEDRYYPDYAVYRQVQWDRYGNQRKQIMERERLAAQSERLRLERERLVWEKRENERLHNEQALRGQWQSDNARYQQQHRQQPKEQQRWW